MENLSTFLANPGLFAVPIVVFAVALGVLGLCTVIFCLAEFSERKFWFSKTYLKHAKIQNGLWGRLFTKPRDIALLFVLMSILNLSILCGLVWNGLPWWPLLFTPLTVMASHIIYCYVIRMTAFIVYGVSWIIIWLFRGLIWCIKVIISASKIYYEAFSEA